jgi:hypothetical protein
MMGFLFGLMIGGASNPFLPSIWLNICLAIAAATLAACFALIGGLIFYNRPLIGLILAGCSFAVLLFGQLNLLFGGLLIRWLSYQQITNFRFAKKLFPPTEAIPRLILGFILAGSIFFFGVWRIEKGENYFGGIIVLIGGLMLAALCWIVVLTPTWMGN